MPHLALKCLIPTKVRLDQKMSIVAWLELSNSLSSLYSVQMCLGDEVFFFPFYAHLHTEVTSLNSRYLHGSFPDELYSFVPPFSTFIG